MSSLPPLSPFIVICVHFPHIYEHKITDFPCEFKRAHHLRRDMQKSSWRKNKERGGGVMQWLKEVF